MSRDVFRTEARRDSAFMVATGPKDSLEDLLAASILLYERGYTLRLTDSSGTPVFTAERTEKWPAS